MAKYQSVGQNRKCNYESWILHQKTIVKQSTSRQRKDSPFFLSQRLVVSDRINTLPLQVYTLYIGGICSYLYTLIYFFKL